jgi:hypothetical protein
LVGVAVESEFELGGGGDDWVAVVGVGPNAHVVILNVFTTFGVFYFYLNGEGSQRAIFVGNIFSSSGGDNF